MKKILQTIALTAIAVVGSSIPMQGNTPQRSLAKDGSTLSANFSQSINAVNRAQKVNSINHFTKNRSSFMKTATAETVVTVPFTHTLGKNESKTNTALYTFIDANEDTKTWKIGGFTAYSVCMKPTDEAITACDDWMISPKIDLKAGEDYIMSYEEGCALSSATYTDKLEVKIGLGATVADMTTEIVAAHTFTGPTFQKVEKHFTVSVDGLYNVGFHAISDKATSGNPKICNFSITKASSVVDPPAAGTIAYELYPKGELKAKVTYTAPNKTVAGADLAAISKVVITDPQKKTYLYEDVEPGEVINVDVELKNSPNNTIQAIAFVNNPDGEAVAGETAVTAPFYAGLDNPLTPTNAVAKLSADGMKVIVSWDAVPEVGESGGYVDPEKVEYYIFDAFGSYYDPPLAVTTDTSYEFDYSDETEQDFRAYQITAGMEEMYYSLDVSTNIITTGTPYSLPYFESFADGDLTQAWCVDPESSYDMIVTTVHDNELQTNTDDEEAEPEYLNSQDGDNGFLFFMPVYKDDMYGIFTGKLSLAGTTNPVLEFFYQGQGSAIDAMIAVDGVTFNTAKTIDLKENPTTGWTLAQIDLKSYMSAPFIQVELRVRAIHNDDTHTWSVPMDNIRIRDLANTDLRLVSLNAPKKIEAGKDVTLTAKIENLGATAATNAKAVLFKNGEEVTQIPINTLQPNEVSTLTFSSSTRLDDPEQIEYKVVVEIDGDNDLTNNTATAKVIVEMPVYPTATGLSATAENFTVKLSWKAPDFSELNQPINVVEDFENPDYQPMTIDNFGDWTLVDGDGLKTYYIPDFKETGNPYQTQPMAYQLYNPQIAGVAPECLIDIPPHSGEQLLVAWSSQGLNDNWLISPELSGNEQTVSFFARSFTIAWAESFEVLYSTTDKDIDSFTVISQVENYPADGEVSEQWAEYKVTLPAGAKYFAIRHNSYDTYALYIDDISFEGVPSVPADLALTGYNIYRDGQKINKDIVSGTSYEDIVELAAKYSYRVSAVYNYGESRYSDAIEVEVRNAGITDIEAEQGQIEFYNLQGVKIQNNNNLIPGIYIMKTENGSKKVRIQ